MSVVHAATESTKAALVCEPPVGKTVDGKVPAPIYFNRFTRDGPLMRLEGRTDKNNRIIGITRVVVSDDEVKQLCDLGFPISALDVGEAAKASTTSERPKTVVPALTVLPTTFEIYRTNLNNTYIPWATYGNFWVPQDMPSGHTYQVVDFTVTPSNYENSGPHSHLAVSTQTLSNSNLDHDFDGKGAAFFAGSGLCGSANKTVLQSWAIQNSVDGVSCGPPCENPVFDGITAQPASCGEWDAVTPKRFLVGSNTSQRSVYWRCQPGGTCPEFVSTDVNSSTPSFRSGGAGVAFLHALGTENVTWYLSFTNVVSYTAP